VGIVMLGPLNSYSHAKFELDWRSFEKINCARFRIYTPIGAQFCTAFAYIFVKHTKLTNWAQSVPIFFAVNINKTKIIFFFENPPNFLFKYVESTFFATDYFGTVLS
jgi:hypothetical protein